MKLSALLVLLAAASAWHVQTGFAQSTTKTQQVFIVPEPNPDSTPDADQNSSARVNKWKAKIESELQAAMARADQSGCPVTLTSAGLTPYLMLLRTSTGAPPAHGGLDLQFRNTSGKEIRSMQFEAEFLAKKSIYDLQAYKIGMHLTATGTSNIDKTFDHLRHLPLPQRTYPVILNTIMLEQVTFIDGSVWSPAKDNNCVMSPNGELQIGAR
jgi:hypothetical protein